MRLVKSALLALALLAAPAFSQLPANHPPLTNQDIVDLLKAGLSVEIITAKIKNSDCNFDTSPAALKDLKAANIPDAVIVAMVDAPTKAPVTAGRKGYVQCSSGADIPLLPGPGTFPAIVQLKCGAQLTVIGEQGAWNKVQTLDGTEGYVSHWFVSDNPSPVAPSRTSGLLPNRLRAVAWRAVPWTTTLYTYQQPGTAQTDCTGSGTWSGTIWQGSSTCTTQYTAAQNIPINWYHYTVYNLVETSDSTMILACTRNSIFSKCSSLVPGDVFEFENKNGKISVVGQKVGKNKEQAIEFEIVSRRSN